MTLIHLTTPINIFEDTGAVPQTLMCDMQPYSGGLAQEEYGLDIDCTMRIYTEPCPFLKSGARVGRESDNPCYTVKYAEHWDDYSMALLDEIPQAVQDSNVNISSGENSMSDIYGGGFY